MDRGKLVRIVEEHASAEQAISEEPIQNLVVEVAGETSDIQRQIDEIRAALEELHPTPAVEPYGGIGHNQPPEFLPLDDPSRTELVESLAVVRLETEKPQPDLETTRQAVGGLRRAAEKIASWAAKKADLAASEFSQQMGKSLADGRLWIAGWLLLSGKLEGLIAAIAHWKF